MKLLSKYGGLSFNFDDGDFDTIIKILSSEELEENAWTYQVKQTPNGLQIIDAPRLIGPATHSIKYCL